MSNRREQIEAMLADDPEDTFLLYALAMELVSEGGLAEALNIFRVLQEKSPPYVPAFFMAGQQLHSLERIEDAREVLRRGIDQARLQGDGHAAGEMSEYLASLGQFGE